MKERIKKKYIHVGKHGFLKDELHHYFDAFTMNWDEEDLIKFEKELNFMLREEKLKRINGK